MTSAEGDEPGAGTPAGALEAAERALGPHLPGQGGAPAPSAPSGPGDAEGAAPAAGRAARRALEGVGEGAWAEEPRAVRARAAFLLGRAHTLEAGGGYAKAAEEHLVRAVKLDPEEVGPWNVLGQALWAKGDLACAQHCFQYGLQLAPNKVGLQELSMLKRQLAKGEAQEENEALVRQSVEDARRAVSLDIADFKSWYVLGNAFLTSYFVASAPSLSILQQALKAYQNAEKNMPGGGYSDLHFNRGIVCQYLDRYQEALESFRAAKDLDATLSEPCDQHVHSLLHTMSQLATLTEAKCHLKPRKIASIAASIAAEKFLPPPSLSPLNLGDLKAGKNAGAVLSCKVLQTLSQSAEVPHYYVALDSDGGCFAIILYGVKDTAIRQSIVISLRDPNLMHVAVKWEGRNLKFPAVRIDSPQQILVGGQQLVGADNKPVITTRKLGA